MKTKGRVIVGMSGGVDSSVAAALLKDQGYDVIGVYILGWTGTDKFPCNWQKEEADARAVAEQLNIPFYTINLSKEYEKAVIDEFFAVYQAGGTPNPDILCNSQIKFKALWQAVRQFEPDFIATGHYVRVEKQGSNEAAVFKGYDTNKDQSYFLWAIDPEILPHLLFPVGELEKPEVRKLAKKYKLPTATKKDSQGICFVGPLKVREFLASRVKAVAGDALLKDGRVLARHNGLPFYTIGQRLGAGSVNWTGDVPPLFVVAKDIKNNRLIIGSEVDTYGSELLATNPNFLLPGAIKLVAKAKIRYRQEDVLVSVSQADGVLKVKFKNKVRAITPGQSIVFYGQNDQLLGGAAIKSCPEQDDLIKNVTYKNQAKTKK